MNRAYPNKINWTNEPSHATPIDETNLGLMDDAIYEIDGRVVTHDTTIASQGQTLQNHETEIDDLENGKVDKVTGKGLSTNDFTDVYKSQIETNQANVLTIFDRLETKVDKVTGKGLSTNDFTDNDVSKLRNDTYTKSETRGLVSKAYHPSGSIHVEDLTASILISANLNNVYNLNGDGTTSNLFIEGAGHPLKDGTNIGVINFGTEETPNILFDDLGGFVDLSGYATTSAMNTALADKVDKVNGKDLSTNDFTDGYKQKIDANESGIMYLDENKVNKIQGKGLSTNDFTDNYKKGISISQELAYDKSKEYIPSSDADFHNVSDGEIFTKDGITYGIQSVIQNPKTKEYIYTLSYSGHSTHGYAFAKVKDPTSDRDDWNILKPSGIVAHQIPCVSERFDGYVRFYSVYVDSSGEEQVSTLIYSDDLYEWTEMDVESVTIRLYQMGNNAFCYTDKLYEIDGLQILPTDLPYKPLKIAYGGGRLVVLTSNKSIYMSYDGIQWKLMGATIYSGDIIYGNGIFLIYAYDEDTVYVSKEGGYIWETQPVTIYNGDNVNPNEREVYEYYFPFREIGYAGGIFFGTNIYHKQGQSLSEDLYGIWTSKDGYNWEITATDIEEEYKVTDNLYNETYIINTKNNLYYPTLSVGDALDAKVDKVQGKGLSTNDYTDTEKQKLANIESNAQANVQSDWNEDDTEDDGYIKNKPNLDTSLSATGNPLTIEAAEANLVECVAEVEAVQEGSGDPSPDNIRPIIGQTEVVIKDCGKNLIGLGTSLNGYAGNTTFTTSDTAIGFYFETKILPDTITINAINGNRAFYSYYNEIPANGVAFEEKDQTQQTLPRTITVNKNYKYIHIQFSYNETNVTNIQVEQGSTATEYEPYKGKTYTIQLGDAIYGSELDVITGKMTVDRALKTYTGDSSEGWQLSTGWSQIKTNVFYANEINGALFDTYTDDYMGINNCFLTYSRDSLLALDDNGIGFSGSRMSNAPYPTVRIEKTLVNDLTEFTTWLSNNPLQVVYELAEPYTIQLTPQQIRLLKGTNHLSCNTGDLTIKYYPDNVLGQLKGDIEKGLNAYYDYQIQALWDKINELQA